MRAARLLLLPCSRPPPSHEEKTGTEGDGASSGAERAEGGRLGHHEGGTEPDGDYLSTPKEDQVHHGKVLDHQGLGERTDHRRAGARARQESPGHQDDRGARGQTRREYCGVGEASPGRLRSPGRAGGQMCAGECLEDEEGDEDRGRGSPGVGGGGGSEEAELAGGGSEGGGGAGPAAGHPQGAGAENVNNGPGVARAVLQ